MDADRGTIAIFIAWGIAGICVVLLIAVAVWVFYRELRRRRLASAWAAGEIWTDLVTLGPDATGLTEAESSDAAAGGTLVPGAEDPGQSSEEQDLAAEEGWKVGVVVHNTSAEHDGRTARPLPPGGLLIDFAALTVEERPIAVGAFKSVFRAEWRRAEGAPETVALLKLRGALGNLALGSASELEREVGVFVTLGRHPHLTALLGVATHPDGALCMLVEFAPCGSLDKVLADAADARRAPSEVVLITVALQICEAMTQLVEHGVVHRDLASRNVLVFRFSPWDRTQVLVKVTDYGQALLGPGGSSGVTTHSGDIARPVRWLSPEALKRRIYSEASDVWAFAVTLWEVLSLALVPYWEEERDAEVVQRVVKRNLLARPDGCSDMVWFLIESCWAERPKERPPFSRLKLQLQDALGDAMARAAQATCVVCIDRAPVIALRPCGHRCVCEECVESVKECPLCRALVEGALRVFDT